MALKITKVCICCGRCAEECPLGAISKGNDNKYEIDADACVECYVCVNSCPVEAIEEE